jgi:O-antigen ligase
VTTPWFPAIQAVGTAGLLIAAYLRSVGVVLVGLIALLIGTIAIAKPTARMGGLDWAVASLGLYEAVSLSLTTYSVNSIWYAEIVFLAVLTYLAVRLSVATWRQVPMIVGVIGMGGLYLAWTAILSFRTNAAALHEVGLHGLVAFRARLISPGSYVLGEWLTILLLALPFACTLSMWLWTSSGTRWWMPAVSLAAPVCIIGALCLSCSRAVFWSMVLFVLLLALLRFRAAVAGLAVIGVCLAIENAAYPGIVQAYVGSHSSQVRSTEGRIAIWKRSLDLFQEHPLWGVGSGNSPLHLNSTGNQDETVGFASRTFSLPFQLLAEHGIVGLPLYGAVFCLAARETFRRRDLVACCLFAGLVAVLARELTYSSLLEHPVTAMLAATILGLICRSGG